MSFRDLSDRKAVLKAIAEFDAMGREAFLSHYGFGKARMFVLLHKGRSYDSKAIVGAAYGHQFGNPLAPSDFSAGQATVVPKLAELGFNVVAMELNEQSAALPEEVPESAWEGARRSVTVNSFERNPAARAACIEHHGSACAICGFDFSVQYGAEFQGFIHVHHVVPLATIGKKYKVDPKSDLLPVCPNCHAVLHYGSKVRTPEQVRGLRKKAGMNKPFHD